MSTRQNKKRKGPRERTVTTLTNGPDSLATPAHFLMSSPFPGSTPNFPFAALNGFQQPHLQQPQTFYPPQPQQMTTAPLPAGENDLEILENLKHLIKSGQHEFYRAIPQPVALANLYLGPNSAPPHHPEQVKQDGLTSPVDINRNRPPRIQNKDARVSISGLDSHVGSTPKVDTAARTPELRPLSDRLGPSSSTLVDDAQPPPSPAKSNRGDIDRRSAPPSRNGSITLNADRHPRPPLYDGRDRDSADRDRDWDSRDRDRDRRDRLVRDDRRRPPPDQRHYEPSYNDRTFVPPPRRYHDDHPPSRTSTLEDIPSSGNGSSRSIDSRLAPPPRTVSPMARDVHPPSRGSSGVLRDPVAPPDDRRVAVPPSSSSSSGPRPVSADRSATESRISSAPRPSIPLEDRITNPKPSLQDRLSNQPAARPQEPPPSTSRPGPTLEERISHPPALNNNSASLPPRPATNTSTVSPRLSDNRPRTNEREAERGRPTVSNGARPDDRSVTTTNAVTTSNATMVTTRNPSRPPPPHEERGRPLAGRTVDRPPGRPRSQDRDRPPPQLDSYHRAASVVRDSDPPRSRGGPPPRPNSPPLSPLPRRSLPPRDRSLPPRNNNYRPDEHRYNDTYTRRLDAMDVDSPPLTSHQQHRGHDHHARYGDSTRNSYVPRGFSPPSAADLARDRERARGMYPPASPPPLSTRGPSHHAHPPPPSSASYDGVRDRDPDRRDWGYGAHEYADRRLEYEDDYWKYDDVGVVRNVPPPPLPPSDRDRYERDLPPLRSQAWDRDPRDDRDRGEHDRRRPDSPPPPPPSRSYDPPPQRSLQSRIVDSYGSHGVPPSDRSYVPPAPPSSSAPPPRDLDRRFPPPPPAPASSVSSTRVGGAGAPPPSYSRIRPRSPSPPARRPPPPLSSSSSAPVGAGAIVDDMRPPPPKRQRDESYHPLPPPPTSSSSLPPSSSGYYSPGDRRKGEYHPLPRVPSPPPPSSGGSGSGYYDRPPPPISSGTSALDRERDRDRERGRDSYAPSRDYTRASYDRPRSPLPPARGGGGSYRPGGNSYVGRDDRRYVPPPPRTA